MTQVQAEMRRRFENMLVAHADLQAKTVALMMAAAGGYADTVDEPATVLRLEQDAQAVIDAAGELKCVIATGGDRRPPGVGA